MNQLEKRKKPLEGSDFGNTWLGNLVIKLGGDWRKIYCRGAWSDLDWNGSILPFNTETAWGPMNEVFKFIKTIYPSLKIYYQAEEDGMGVFITNDAEGSYFSDRYLGDNYDEPLYYETIDEAAESVSGIVGHHLEPSVDAIEKALDQYQEEHEDEDIFYSFHEIQVLDT